MGKFRVEHMGYLAIRLLNPSLYPGKLGDYGAGVHRLAAVTIGP